MTAKTVNYTPEQTASMVADYQAGVSVEKIASDLGKTVRSVVAKLSREKVYQAKTYVSKTGEKPIKKDAHADFIGEALGLSEADMESLTKANKTALAKIADFIRAEKSWYNVGAYAPTLDRAIALWYNLIMELLNTLIEYLEITKPVTLTIKTRKNKDADAFYLPHYSDRTAKLIGHRITIYTVDTSRDFDTLLAHELIHAKQEEMRVAEIHGPVFTTLAADLEHHFGFEEIYIHDVDLE